VKSETPVIEMASFDLLQRSSPCESQIVEFRCDDEPACTNGTVFYGDEILRQFKAELRPTDSLAKARDRQLRFSANAAAVGGVCHEDVISSR
jgi:hypothetical protein